MKTYWVYIMSSSTGTLYVGVTNDLERRVLEHKNKTFRGFTGKYDINRLVYFEETNSAFDAIEREKQIKNWRRDKKLALIQSMNPKCEDLSRTWYS